ncbi:hypothetical protein [Hoeflea poritis]|uniref:Carbon storage regulator n=1 Tax=Hoeflea poritis TaxID=2993659 RepID=A0ABT4VMJ6_9HYPH|nr:hypothetical protein [Hoeflea poritis]MDA4845943.1 hypothetical protein [Hoeflea poritis]
MLSKTLRIGESLKIGDAALIRVADKSGRMVKLAIATRLPIEQIAAGIDIRPIAAGITGETRPVRVLEPRCA